MQKYVCTVCHYEYDPAVGDPDNGVAAGTAFADLPDEWVCPLCSVGKDMFEETRPDKDFNLETLTYQEIFEGIKFGVATAIRKFSKDDISVEDLRLKEERCYTKKAYAEDMNLYPKIYLDLFGQYSVLITPFNVELLIVSSQIKTYSCEELGECFYKFMCDKFPSANYEKIYEKYLISVEKIKKQHEKHLFL